MAMKSWFIASLLLSSATAYGSDGSVVQDIQLKSSTRRRWCSITEHACPELEIRSAMMILVELSVHYLRQETSMMFGFCVTEMYLLFSKSVQQLRSITFMVTKQLKKICLSKILDASNIRIGETLDRTMLANIEKGLGRFLL